MRFIAYLIVGGSLLPLVLSILVSFTPSRFLELPGDTWTLDWYRQVLANPVWTRALANSFLVAALTTTISIPTALGAAVGLSRGGWRRRSLWETALLAPLALPAVAIAAGLLAVIRPTPLWGSHLGLALAHSVIAMPVAYLALRASLERVDPTLEAAARGLGASRWQAFRYVTLPLITPGLLAATLFAIVVSLNEVTLTLFLSTRDTTTLPIVIWPHLRFAISPLVAAASGILFLISAPALAAGAWRLVGRRADSRRSASGSR
jgi:ABC-type spermidine/putrescine transport system permease subunit II